jgi:hypothetical protein
MPRRPIAEIELNFDGLTDSLTNLVGTLILFVFLLFVLTRESALPGVASGFDNRAGGNRSATDLLQEITRLQALLKSLESQVAQQESDLPQLRQRLDTLLAKRGSRQASSR